MSKKRVYELAKELGIDSKELIARLEKFGIAVKSHSSTVEDADMEKIQRELLSPEPLEMVEKRIKSTVIRRRVVRPPVEEFKGDSVKVEAEIPVTLEEKEVLAREVQEEKREPVISRQETSVESAVPLAPPQVSVDRVKKHEELIAEEKPTVKVERKIEQKVIVKTDVKADVKVEVKPDFRIEKKPDAKVEMKPEIKEEVKPDLKREAVARAEEGVVAKRREEEKVSLKRETKETVEETLTKVEEVAGEVPEVTVPVQPVESVEVPGEKKVPPRVVHEKVTEEVRKEPSEKPELKIVKEIVPPSPEKLVKWEIEKPKVKGKKTVEVIMEELPSARKKAFIKKLVDRRDWRGEEDREDRILKWREGKKTLPAKVKKTVITVPKAIKRRIKIGETITVGELAKRMGVKASEVINKLMGLGLMATINQSIDCDVATIIASEFGYQVEPVGAEFDEPIQREEPPSEKMKPRAPVVTVMGHVDHGKTSLLDAIRQTNVIDGEVGGITQAIGAYHVTIKDREIVFLDTPGHEAFTAMRARGAHVTDIVVLVVAADDGVMDQTVEAINHARVANVPIIVAINKIDKPGADPGRIKQSLAEYNLVPEEWGGDTIYCEVSAKKRIGIEELLEMILLQADVMELKADPDRPARGVIIESKLDRGRGAVATVLIQEGTLHEGDAFVAKTEYGKVRAMVDDQGRRVKEAGPSMPVEVIGFSGVPQVGAEFICVEDEKKARSIAEYWIRKERERELSATSKITLEQLYQKMKEGVKELNVIIKGDVQGSIEALTEALNKLSTQDIRVKIIHSSTGAVTETDVMLASASNAIIIGFNVRPDSRVIDIAEKEGVEIKLYEIIYDVIADMRAAMEGLLEPEYKEVVIGRAEVRELFRIPKVGTVAGCYVAEGKVTRNANVKLVRDGILIYDGRIHSLKRFKDDVKEVTSGLECGIGIEGFNDLNVGDVIEAYVKEKVEKKLQ